MANRQVFYSFHFDKDVMRVQQIRNIGALQDNKPVSPNEWEAVRRKGDAAIEKWIDDNMKYRSCVIVLIGEETAKRQWVLYEIRKAWNDGKGLFGIHVHNIKCPNSGKCSKGVNPFDQVKLKSGKYLSSIAACYDPDASDAYGDIAKKMEGWVGTAISQRL